MYYPDALGASAVHRCNFGLRQCARPFPTHHKSGLPLRRSNHACGLGLGGGLGLGAASAVQTKPAVHWAPGLLARAEQRLTEHVGPIARLLVSKAAAAAGNEAELYAAWPSPSRTQPSERISSGSSRSICRQWARWLHSRNDAWPIVPLDPSRAARQGRRGFDRASRPYGETCGDERKPGGENPEDLFQRLLARIPSESEKAELLKKLRSLHPG